MGDMGDMFKDLNIEKKRKKRKNLEWSTNKLKELGVDFESKNDGILLIVKYGAYVANFYPSTGGT